MFRSRSPLVLPLLFLPLAACAGGALQTSGEAGPPLTSEAEVRSAPKAREVPFAAALDLQRQGRLEEAAEALRDILDAEPDHGPAHARLAAVLSILGDGEGARAHAGEAWRLGERVAALDAGRSVKAAPAAKAAVSVGQQVRVDGGTSYSIEPAAMMFADRPSEIFAAWYDSRQIPGTPTTTTRFATAVSRDGGQTWTESLLDVPPEILSRIAADPMFTHDPRTGTIWMGGVSLGNASGVFVYRKDRDAAGFGPPVTVWKEQGIDKPLMAVGPDPVNPLDPAQTRLYVVHNLGLQISTDRGATWTDPQPVGNSLSYHPKVGPSGELYVVYWDPFDKILLRRSLDGGRTLEPAVVAAVRRDFWDSQLQGVRFPGRFRHVPLPSLAVDPNDGTLYLVYFDTTSVVNGRYDMDLYLTRSVDRGATWSAPRVINSDSDPAADQFFPWLEVDGKGRLHLVYYDTRHTPQEDNAPEARLDAYYAFSGDRGETWSEHRLTPASFSTVAPTPSAIVSQFIGDYNGLAVAGDHAHAFYMSTQNGQADIFTHAITLREAATCVTGGESLCLNGGRFRLRASWDTADRQGSGQAVQLTADSGYFWFFGADNVELMVKVLNACVPPFDRFWVYSAGLTDVGVRLTVEDLRTGDSKEYTHRRGTPYTPKFDTDAFRTCGAE